MKAFIVGSLLAAAVSAVPMPAPAPVSDTETCWKYEKLTPEKQPGIPTAATAKTQLAALTVKAAYDDGGYNRDLFPTWGTVSGTCNTR